MTIRDFGAGVRRTITTLFRSQAFSPDVRRDVFLVSYPRSGNTWLRAMLSHLLTGKKPDSLAELDYIIPDIHYNVPVNKVIKMPFYVVKSHEPFRLGKASALYKRIVYIMRDPRDVCVSYYRYLSNIDMQDVTLNRFAMDFATGRVAPCSWQEHVSGWLDARDSENENDIIVVRYEDLIRDTIEGLKCIKDFVGIGSQIAPIGEIVDQYRRDGMVALEEMANRPEIQRENMFFIGEAIAGRGSEILSNEAEEKILAYSGHVMKKYGYI